MGIITLTTDFGAGDHYAGVMKGVIAGINPSAIVIDITHGIGAYNIAEAAFKLHASYGYFPGGAVHVAVVDPGVGSARRAIAAEAGGYLFVGPDNGVFSMVFDKSGVDRIIEITNPAFMLPSVSRTFHGRDIFAPAAAHLSRGVALEDLGNGLSSYERLDIRPPLDDGDVIEGRAVYADRFGNLVTNIPGSVITEGARIRAGDMIIDGMSASYADGKEGELIALTGSSGFLEISINKGSALEFFGGKLPEVKIPKI
ncbi:MAG TPA: SAM-dependent chlorinase/fluorinase [Thermodesulfobacteriota bacterium]|nr:SAM-dependent chlorinase/fluorinase [Thermodesulfobacteriota bacterium]